MVADEIGSREGELGGEDGAGEELCHCYGVLVCYRWSIMWLRGIAVDVDWGSKVWMGADKGSREAEI
jgi:hypothetical protein